MKDRDENFTEVPIQTFYEENLKLFGGKIAKALEASRIYPLEIQSRVKNTEDIAYSPHDLYGFRIILANKIDCYKTAICLINSFEILKLKDYYVNHHPQEETYRAIHIQIKVGNEKNIEVQIKTRRMHKRQMLKRKTLGDHYWKRK